MKLFEPLIEESRQHPNFRRMLQSGNVYNYDVLQEWARGFEDRDGKFVKEFQTTFDSCFWELYLHAALKKYGLTVDFSVSRPDFYVRNPDFCIEAAVASNAIGDVPEHDRIMAEVPEDLKEFNRRSIIRISNTFLAKHRKYVESYQFLEHVRSKPFVLAVVNVDQPFSFLAIQRPMEAVLFGSYVDEEKYLASGRTGELRAEELPLVLKDNGSPIELGVFSTPAFKEISAVVFSGCANMGKVRALSADPSPGIVFAAFRQSMSSVEPQKVVAQKHHYSESLLDGLRIYHNPFAEYPLDPAIFRRPEVMQWYVRNGQEVAEQRDGQLLFRTVISLVTKAPIEDDPTRQVLTE